MGVKLEHFLGVCYLNFNLIPRRFSSYGALQPLYNATRRHIAQVMARLASNRSRSSSSCKPERHGGDDLTGGDGAWWSDLGLDCCDSRSRFYLARSGDAIPNERSSLSSAFDQ